VTDVQRQKREHFAGDEGGGRQGWGCVRGRSSRSSRSSSSSSSINFNSITTTTIPRHRLRKPHHRRRHRRTSSVYHRPLHVLLNNSEQGEHASIDDACGGMKEEERGNEGEDTNTHINTHAHIHTHTCHCISRQLGQHFAHSHAAQLS